MRQRLPFLLLPIIAASLSAADDYKPGPDSLPQQGVPQGELIKDQYTAKGDGVFPGTERDYTIYLPPGLDKSKPAPFMVFQDGVIYQAPTVFDNLIAKKEIPPLIGIFIKPGVVPAANPNALPRFNRSYEYDSVTDTYARFLIDEFLPAISQKHGLNLSADPNDAAIAGNSSGGICAFMVAWHRSDRFRRVFTGVGTYVGIHGADQLPVLVRKMEPKPLRAYLQSGTHDNDLYCGDWWMANQMMERSLTWAGYDVNHTWGEGGHNQKQATAIFPDVLRWLWKGWPEQKEVKANPRGDSKWKGYEVLGDGGWDTLLTLKNPFLGGYIHLRSITSDIRGNVFAADHLEGKIYRISADGKPQDFASGLKSISSMAIDSHGNLLACANEFEGGYYFVTIGADGKILSKDPTASNGVAASYDGKVLVASNTEILMRGKDGKLNQALHDSSPDHKSDPSNGAGRWTVPAFDNIAPGAITPHALVFSPDQTLVYVAGFYPLIASFQIGSDGLLGSGQGFFELESSSDRWSIGGFCVDTEGRLYVATWIGIQVCDQAGRVNFIIPTPQPPFDVCFGGKNLSDLFIACGDKVYKRPMKVHGIVSGQMAPIKPKAPHL